MWSQNACLDGILDFTWKKKRNFLVAQHALIQICTPLPPSTMSVEKKDWADKVVIFLITNELIVCVCKVSLQAQLRTARDSFSFFFSDQAHMLVGSCRKTRFLFRLFIIMDIHMHILLLRAVYLLLFHTIIAIFYTFGSIQIFFC